MADSSNSSATSSTGSTGSTGSQTSTSTTSAGSGSTGSTGSQTSTTSNSTGNFSGGLPGLGGGSWGGPTSETAAAHASGVQGPGLANGNFGSAWSNNGNSGSGSGDYTYNNTSYSNNKSEPVMTVDEVYGKGNQSIVESQGDYTATSNEKSNVETSTFGKQDTITVTPESVTENKGFADNSAIDSIEGLSFQQKDKESQGVLDSKKSRDDAEAKDKANQMRDQLKAKVDVTEENAEFQVGDVNEDIAAAETKAYEAAKAYEDLKAQADDRQAELKEAGDNLSKASIAVREASRKTAAYDADSNDFEIGEAITLSNGSEVSHITYVGKDPAIKAAYEARNEAVSNLVQADLTYADKKSEYDSYISYTTNAKAQAEQALADYNTIINSEYVGAVSSNTPSDTKQAFDTAIENAAAQGANEETVQAMTDIAANIEGTMETIQEAIAHNDIPTYIEAQKTYNKNLEEALDFGNRLTQTDFNKDFVAAVAKANEFDVTLSDGSKQKYSEFATEMATKSPEVAKAMYEAKADKLEAEHPVLAKVERAKAQMVGTWIGSKFTFADNTVRSQFSQMAKTNMRATYAAYNNVLNDPNATEAQKAEAAGKIEQANSLMRADAALQASTGFFSGIGDSMSDGVYGVTDPNALNAYQKTLNAIDNFAKITLGLGVTPGANKAYQNMYYIADAKVKESGLFSRDFDSDGFALCQEYGNNAAAGMIAGAGELATGIALFFNPAMSSIGLNLVVDSITTFTNGLYGVQKDARKAEKYTQEVLSYFREASSIAAETGNKEAVEAVNTGITQIENFELESDEVGNLDNWLEGSGSNTTDNSKFNQSLSYDEWLKLIEADPTMQEYAKKLIAEKKEK